MHQHDKYITYSISRLVLSVLFVVVIYIFNDSVFLHHICISSRYF